MAFVFAHPALGGSIEEGAQHFENAVEAIFNGDDILKIQKFEREGKPEDADRIIQERLKEWFPAPFKKGLAEKCAAFELPGLCEATIIERIQRDEHQRKMDAIYNEVQ